jgi:hypothetical protein
MQSYFSDRYISLGVVPGAYIPDATNFKREFLPKSCRPRSAERLDLAKNAILILPPLIRDTATMRAPESTRACGYFRLPGVRSISLSAGFWLQSSFVPETMSFVLKPKSF